MTRQWFDRTYSEWEPCPSFEAKDGRVVHPVRTPGRDGSEARVRVFDVEVDHEDPGSVELGGPQLMVHLLSELTWWPTVKEINYVWVGPGPEQVRPREKPWGNQGIARKMLDLAREIEPSLRHAPCENRTYDGEEFVRKTDPDQACRGMCGDGCRNPLPEPPVEDVRPSGLWSRIRCLLEY